MKTNRFNTRLLVWTMVVLMFACSDDDTEQAPPHRLSVPNLLTPASTGVFSVQLEWEPINGAAYYEVDVATDAEFTNLVSPYDKFIAENIRLSVSGLSAQTTYFFRVRGVNGELISEFSNSVSATTAGLLAPTIEEVSDVGTISFTVSWSAVEEAEFYEVDLATDAAFTNLVEPYDKQSVTPTRFTFTGLEGDTEYFARVRAAGNGATSAFSSTATARTLVPEPGTPLKSIADFPIGMAYQTARLTDQHTEIYVREYDQFTAEWQMKMDQLFVAPGQYNFETMDQLVNYAVSNGMDVHGHALVWHSSTPTWIENFEGTDEEFEDLVEDFITTVVDRYKDQIRSWDVVNEAFNEDGTYRETVFLERMGPDYIAKCHEWAAAADPDCILIYNDFNLYYNAAKLTGALDMAQDLMDRGIKIDGIGFQMHIDYNMSTSVLESQSRRVTDMGLMLHYSELDVKVNPSDDINELTDERAELQRQKIAELVEVYKSLPAESQYGITIWGLRDSESWIIPFQGHIDWPLLYNDDFTFKKAHTGFLEGLED